MKKIAEMINNRLETLIDEAGKYNTDLRKDLEELNVYINTALIEKEYTKR